ncbi:MAG: glucose-1-phosphate adenylyltransferase subunit GlgD [Oscillospiraceae bacterium]|nr:glucose-1-phosphate adenylyltransferase subunit GlgD [Oscillospiraceae bacterium]
MISSKEKVLGILFPNSYDKVVPELTNLRSMASIPFASRYRIVDFVLSAMSHAGIDDIFILPNKNYNSLTDHLGSGREWDLVRKQGGLHIFPPYSTNASGFYNSRVEALAGIIDFLRRQKEEYILMADTNIACNYDFTDMIETHKASGADITIAYTTEEFPDCITRSETNDRGFYYCFEMDGSRITNILINLHNKGEHNFSHNVYILKRELLIDLINTGFLRGANSFERDILIPRLNELKVCGYEVKQYCARISDIKSYFDENMKLLDPKNLDALFAGASVYTKIRDDNPTSYHSCCKVSNIMAADGCSIRGEVENSILFRGVHVLEGAVVKNCILMQDTVVGQNAKLEYVITDKNVTISEGKELKGDADYPVYIDKRRTV